MKGLTQIDNTKGEIHHLDMQERIIEDIKEMDMDCLKDLIEHMYPVEVSDKKGDEGETLILEIRKDCEDLTLNKIF
jgi:hypothetical protein